MPRTETIRDHSDPGRSTHVCLESVQAILTDPRGTTATERHLAAEVVASFALTDEVADLLGMPRTTSIRALADALAMQSAEFRVAIAIARSER